MKHKRLQFSLYLMIVDAFAILTAFVATEIVYLGLPINNLGVAARLIIPLYLVVAIYQGAFSTNALTSWWRASRRACTALILTAAILLFVLFFAKATAEFSRVASSLGLLVSCMLLAAHRVLALRMAEAYWGPGFHNILVIQDDGPELRFQNAYRINAVELELTPEMNNPEALDRVGKLVSNMDRVIVSCSMDRRQNWAKILRAAGVHGEVVSEALFEMGALSLKREPEFTTLVISTGPLGARARVIKRLMDLAFGFTALVAFLPLFLLIAAAIKVEDGGPVFFLQRRVGRANRFFEIYKFRSMTPNKAGMDGNQSTSRDDQRITKVGKFLRRTSLDELPQLLNVIAGEMSIVGPRPHAIRSQVGDLLFWHVDRRYWDRHSLKPGLTGLAQIKGFRGATNETRDLTERVRHDLEYISTWSPWLDLKIILKTFRVLMHSNAY
ncbi:exopolysaccharide biosynthesis polyprenyl glycosylphosphotransferase [Aurantiacibacter zhengii]|nr:exopolysaccharide biosynthesis polyprenyl glycosylphosphotransferase [Aurantiacibacter zhengii]